MAAKYIMKCNDDTFVRMDAVEFKKIKSGRSLYVKVPHFGFQNICMCLKVHTSATLEYQLKADKVKHIK